MAILLRKARCAPVAPDHSDDQLKLRGLPPWNAKRPSPGTLCPLHLLIRSSAHCLSGVHCLLHHHRTPVKLGCCTARRSRKPRAPRTPQRSSPPTSKLTIIDDCKPWNAGRWRYCHVFPVFFLMAFLGHLDPATPGSLYHINAPMRPNLRPRPRPLFPICFRPSRARILNPIFDRSMPIRAVPRRDASRVRILPYDQSAQLVIHLIRSRQTSTDFGPNRFPTQQTRVRVTGHGPPATHIVL